MNKKIWVVIIDNDAGLDVTVRASYEEAKAYLEGYVRTWWDKEVNPNKDEDQIPIPERITQEEMDFYFEESEERADIVETTLPEGF